MKKYIAMFFLMCLSGVALGHESGRYYDQLFGVEQFAAPDYTVFADIKPGVIHEEFLDERQITVTGENTQITLMHALAVDFIQGAHRLLLVRSDAPVEVGWRSC